MFLSFHRKNSANNSERITLTRKSVGDWCRDATRARRRPCARQAPACRRKPKAKNPRESGDRVPWFHWSNT